MANVSLWSNVGVTVESALATALVVTAITKANPGVVTFTGTPPSNGVFVKLLAQGMAEVDARVFRVAGAAGQTFQLEGENTINYGTFSSGTAEPITFGTTLTSATGLTASGGEFDFIDITTIHDSVKKQIPGAASAASYSFECLWDVADAAQLALKQASDTKSQRAAKIAFSNGQKVVFVGFVGATLLPIGQTQDKVTTTIVLTMFGRPTVYAT